MKHYGRIGALLMIIGGAIAIYGTSRLPYAIAATIIALVLCTAGLVPALGLIDAWRAAHNQREEKP